MAIQPLDWERVRTLFEESLEQPAEARAAFLDRACSQQPELRAEIESLLRANDRAGSFLTDAAQETRVLLSRVDERIGAWRVLRELGRGGMGTVYLAERADGEYTQQVALKVIKRGLDTTAIINRFLRERQILAHLKHPGIARFLDAGTTSDGLPFFVMEWIDGSSLIDYCAARGLGLDARLRLFCEVCQAVQYAHNNLVVHRDLKPSNILVTADGQVKLLDFGIAKVLADDADPDRITLTDTESRPITPEYAAPEQLRGELATTAADIYSLGALLYQLLTGQLPYRLEQRTPEAALGAMATGDPPPPSRALAERSQVARRLRGDLDSIVLTALRAEAERRYPTAAALADDIERYLNGLPILAHADSPLYRTRKFVQRHARGVATAVSVLTFVIALSGWYTVQLRAERNRARAAAARAEAAQRFLVRTIEQSNPMPQTAPTVARTVSDLLHAARERLKTELSEQPDLQAELGVAVAKAQLGLGETRQALELMQSSTDALRQLGARNTTMFAEAMTKLGIMRSDAGDFTAGETALRESVAVLESLPAVAEVPRLTRLAQTALANLLQRSGRSVDAATLREAVLAAHARLPDHERDPDFAWNLYNLAIDYLSAGRYADAERPLREAERLQIANWGESDPRLVNVTMQLSSFLGLRGDFDAALEYERRTERLLGDQLAETHPLRAALHRLRARRLLFIGDTAAIAAARTSVDLYRRGGYFALGSALSSLGSTMFVHRRIEEAARAFDEARAILQKQMGPDHAETRLSHIGHALALWQLRGEATYLQQAEQQLTAMLRDGQGTTRYFADAAAWYAAALEARAPGPAGEWRKRAEPAFAATYPDHHPWRTSLARTR